MLTNFRGGVLYISNDWDIPQNNTTQDVIDEVYLEESPQKLDRHAAGTAQSKIDKIEIKAFSEVEPLKNDPKQQEIAGKDGPPSKGFILNFKGAEPFKKDKCVV